MEWSTILTLPATHLLFPKMKLFAVHFPTDTNDGITGKRFLFFRYRIHAEHLTWYIP